MAEMRMVLHTVTMSTNRPTHAPRARWSRRVFAASCTGVCLSAAAAVTATRARPPDSTHLLLALTVPSPPVPVLIVRLHCVRVANIYHLLLCPSSSFSTPTFSSCLTGLSLATVGKVAVSEDRPVSRYLESFARLLTAYVCRGSGLASFVCSFASGSNSSGKGQGI
jgi:hypothetical protein